MPRKNFFKEYQPSHRMLHPFDPIIKVFLPLIPRWIHPNHFSGLRIALTPYLVYVLWSNQYVWGLILFSVLAVTDALDGSVARLRNLITPLGTVLDPVADKILIGATVLILLLKINPILAAVVVGLEFLFLLGGVIKTSTHGEAIDLEANLWGKTKMVLQVAAVVILFAGLISGNGILITIAEGVFWFAASFAIMNLFAFSL